MKSIIKRSDRILIYLCIFLCIFDSADAQKIILKGTQSWGQGLQSKIYIQNIYKKEFINRTGYIKSLTFYPDTDPFMNLCNGTINKATVFAGEISQNSYNGSNWISIDSLSPIYTGEIVFKCDSVEIQLNRPIFYSGNRNLVFAFVFEDVSGYLTLKRSENIGYSIFSSNLDNMNVVNDPPVPSNAANITINLGVTFVTSSPNFFWVFPPGIDFSYKANSLDSFKIYSNGYTNYDIYHQPTWLKRETVLNSKTETLSTIAPNNSFTNILSDSIVLTYGANNEKTTLRVTQKAIPYLEELLDFNIYDSIRVLQSFDYDNDLTFEYLCLCTNNLTFSILKRNNSNGYTRIEICKALNTADEIGNVLIEDLDNDNIEDIVILEGGGPLQGRVSIIYNKITSFIISPSTIYPLSTDLKLQDLDNDGDKDIMISGINTNYVTGDMYAGEAKVIFYENMDGSFMQREDIKITDAIGKNSSYDFDNDGDIDIIMAGSDINGNTNSYLLKNNRSWNFTEVPISINGFCNGKTTAGDINSDGLPDIASIGALCFNQNGEAFIFTQSGNNSFSKQNFVLPKYPKGDIKFGDFNSDGRLDLLAATYDEWRFNSLSDVYYNEETSFSKGNLELTKLNYAVNIVFSDITNDNNLDFILSGVHNNRNISSFWNNNAAKNNKPEAPDSLWSAVSLNNVTFNWGDGYDKETPIKGLTYNIRLGTTRNGNEIISSNSHDNGKRKVFDYGNAFQNNHWQIKNLLPGKYYWSVQTIDNSFTGSEFSPIDSFVIHDVFELQSTNLKEITYGNASWADLDNDSDPDLILMGGTDIYVNPKCVTNIYYNDQGNFIHNTNDTLNGFLNTNPGIKAVDIDNDNLIDLVVCGKSNWDGDCKMKVFRNTGNGFIALPFEVTSDNGTSLDVADFNNDGLTDVVLANAKTSIYFNKGNGVFEKSPFDLPGSPNGGVKAVDIDNDMDYDLILIGNSYDYESNIYINNNGSFTASFKYPSFSSGSIGIIDFNNDNFFDFIVHGNSIINGSYGNASAVFMNYNGKSFTRAESHIRGVSFSDVEIGDYNNDGWSDLIIAGNSGNRISRLYENKSGSDFEEIEYNFYPESFGSLSFADANKDGNLDLLITGGDGYPFVKFYRNYGGLKNDPPNAPAGLKVQNIGGSILLYWDKAYDNQSQYKGLTYNLRVGITPGGSEIVSPMSNTITGYRKVTGPGNVQMNTGWKIENLPKGIYYWSVQAVDQSFAGGEWAPEQTFKLSIINSSFLTDTVCLGTPTNFTDASFTSGSAINNWSWDFGDGSSSTIQNPVHTYSTSGDFSVTFIASSAEYSDTLIKTVTVLPAPTSAFSVDPVCHGKASVFVNTSSGNGLTISSWHWDLGDGQSSSLKDPPSHFYAQPGSYKTKMTINASNGCSDTLTMFAQVGEYPVVIMSADGPTSFCSGSSVNLSVIDKTNYTYQWNLNEIPITDALFPSHKAGTSGSYFVNVTNTIANCLSTSQKVSVTVIDKPAKPFIKYDGPTSGFCPTQENITMNIDQASSSYNYQWKRNGVPIDNATNISFTGEAKAGIYSVSAFVSGCATESNEITLNPNDAFPKPQLYVQGPVVWYMAASNDTAAQYHWYRNNELIQGADKYLYVANKTLGTYKVIIANKAGCFTMSDEVTIPVSKGDMTKFSIPKNYLVKEDVDPFENLKIYPNPTPGLFTIEMDNNIFGELDIRIFTNEGRQILNIKFEKTTEHFASQVDLSGNPRGMYMINLMIEKYFASRKLVVE